MEVRFPAKVVNGLSTEGGHQNLTPRMTIKESEDLKNF
jgi:hypothetical protein